MSQTQPPASPESVGADTAPLTLPRRRWPGLLRTPPSPLQLALGAVLLLGAALRLTLVLRSDFPLNDGGLFTQMAIDLQHNNFVLPAFTSYNGLRIPFAYSPLPMYVLALLHLLTGIGWFTWLRVLPFLAACGVLLAFLAFARAYLRAPLAVLCSVAAFAIMPRSWIWLLMGGGLTRAPGFLFAILALAALYRALTRERTRDALFAGVFFGLAALCHIESAEFCGYSAVLLLFAHGQSLRALRSVALMALLGAAISAPWWGTVLAQHGIGPFLAARSTGVSVFDQAVRWDELHEAFRFGFDGTHEPLLPVVAFLAVIGGAYCLVKGRIFLPAWTVLIVLLDYRAWQTYFAVPYCCLAGIALADVLLPAAGLRLSPVTDSDATPSRWRRGWLREQARGLAAAVQRHALLSLLGVGVLGMSIVGGLNHSPTLDFEQSLLVGLSHNDRAAMSWMQGNTPASARVVVLTGRPWFGEGPAEWFPVLAQRSSIDTIQGDEWLQGGLSFRRRQIEVGTLQGCSSGSCLEATAAAYGVAFDYIYVQQPPSSNCCQLLVASLRVDARYALLYDKPGAAIFARLR